ncbi:MAG: YqjF family protein [Pyrinomonadaceae bacterium]
MLAPREIDRLTLRARPGGWPLMRQWWGKLLFMHWRVPAEELRPLIPSRLEIDTFDGSAWIGVVPFTMWGVRQSWLPAVPRLSAFHELNVRTYVHLDGVPGVWFCSLDAANPLAVWGARRFYHLPYFNARMSLDQRGQTITYRSERTHRGAPSASFAATWEIGDPLGQTQPDALDFFLTERYCLYAAAPDGRLYRCRIFHEPWPLRAASLTDFRATMIEAQGLQAPADGPLLHYAEALKVDVWPLARV